MNGDDVIFVSSGAVSRANVDPAGGAVEIAKTVTGALAGCSGEVVVAIPSAWCLAARVESSVNARDDHKTLLFRLEEKLPLAAEQIVADFILQEHSGRAHALGVAARLEVLRPLVAAVEAAGLVVRSVSPLALLAAQQSAADDPGDAIELWPEGAQVNVIARRGRRTTAWSLVAGDDSDAMRRETDVQRMAFDRPPRVERREQLEASAATTARSILAGRTRPWVELRRGALSSADRIRSHRRPLNLALAAAAALLILLTGAMLVRAARYERLVTTYERQLASEFSRAFPDWPPPTNVRAVIDSEFRKAQAQRAGAGLNARQTSALRTLHDVLSRFPAHARCDVDHLTFGDGSFELQGRLHALEDVEPLAAAAREAGLEVPPPVTRRGEDGSWAVTLRGARPQPSVAVAGQP
jgi:type II secretory pathway component PulL